MTGPVDLTACPHCNADLRGEPHPECRRHSGGSTHYSRAVAVEIRGVYDGALFFACPLCYGTWHRWDPVRHGRRYDAAERHRGPFTEHMRSRGATLAPPIHHDPLTEEPQNHDERT